MDAISYRMGIDIGSTTAKLVVLEPGGNLVYSAYRRHNAEPLVTLLAILNEIQQTLGKAPTELLITGSAGMGITEKYHLPFIQEVVASADVIRSAYPQVRTLVDIGGEDAKIIFFDSRGRPDIRMNGSCAGGTGAFIDEMATLLGVPVSELDQLAQASTNIYPMASRCGVFAKTDLQNLLSRQIPKEDIAASVFQAVVLQVLATLSRGRDPQPKVLFCGGPLTFLPTLKAAFMKILNLGSEDVLEAENAVLIPATGAALAVSGARRSYMLGELIELLEADPPHAAPASNRHRALFESTVDYQDWQTTRLKQKIGRVDVHMHPDQPYFLGIDSGSTTTKLVLIDAHGRVAYSYYINNSGNAIKAVQTGLSQVNHLFTKCSSRPVIRRSVATGYGEDLIKAAFGIDEGMVETLAHFRAARAFDPEVTFILDIGGQDMKAIFVKNGHIQNIEINEACSSGCGSFIETFARNMGYKVADFAQLACLSEDPCNLGTRCTVFMNSRVKQALREGAQISDISAGLAYSVIKNALHKVLKITDTSVLGEHIVVQGGAFRNPAVQRALEQLLGRPVICPDMAELMGAYGAALTALDTWRKVSSAPSTMIDLSHVEQIGETVRKEIRCRGCENRCAVTKMTFPNGNHFFSGNRCENIYSNGGRADRKGVSVPALKYQLLFDREMSPEGEPLLTIGIPRVLNMFENFPFWNTLFVECGIAVKLSAPSSNALYQSGATNIMSENLCFPGKLVSGHIMDLINAGVDRIFYPMVFFEKGEFADADNTFNCPVVSGYADVVHSAIDPTRRYGIPLDAPPINLNDEKLLYQALKKYLGSLGVPDQTIKRALKKANAAHEEFKERLRTTGADILADAQQNDRPVVLLMGRPYHIDPLINHKIPDLLTDLGVDVLTEDSIPLPAGQTLDNRHVMTQWEYVNRYFYAARWVGAQKNLELVQLNSFGCGPDPFILDEVRSILGEFGKCPTILRIDEIESAGSTKLRLRSMMESLWRSDSAVSRPPTQRVTTKIYQMEDRIRTLIVPDFSPFCSPPITRPLVDVGINVVQLPQANHSSVDVGLKYTNNEICYPGIICIGDLIKALQSGEYDLSKTAVGFTQTGGQCRATSYVSLIKKAMVAAGFKDIPVVTLTTNLKSFNDQPGARFDRKEYVYKAAIGMMFTDALSDMYFSSAIREKEKGTSQAIADKYLTAFMDGSIPITKDSLLETLEQAVGDFNRMDIYTNRYPRAGIVGEVYVKYNAFSNNHAAQWLMDQGIEVVMPNFLEFFTGGLVSLDNGVRTLVKNRDLFWALAVLAHRVVHHFTRQFDAVMEGYRNYRPRHDIRDVAAKAKEILSLNHQYGEGWLIAGEIAGLVKDGVQNVLCLQPFGCIANHVIAKGQQKKLQEVYPQLNLLFLDADAGVSEVNFFNRMHFFVNQAKSEF